VERLTIANTYEIKVFGRPESSESFFTSKAKKEKTNKIWDESSSFSGKRL
jgi:hypothetical protein